MARKLVVGLRDVDNGEAAQSANPKDAYGLSKVPLSAVPRAAKIMMAMGLALGTVKYGAYNWRVSKVRLRVYLEALERHLDALLDGEELDPESEDLPHIAMMLANCAIIADGMYGSKIGLIDDRPLEGNAAQMLRQYAPAMKALQAAYQEDTNGSAPKLVVKGRNRKVRSKIRNIR